MGRAIVLHHLADVGGRDVVTLPDAADAYLRITPPDRPSCVTKRVRQPGYRMRQSAARDHANDPAPVKQRDADQTDRAVSQHPVEQGSPAQPPRREPLHLDGHQGKPRTMSASRGLRNHPARRAHPGAHECGMTGRSGVWPARRIGRTSRRPVHRANARGYRQAPTGHRRSCPE